MESEKQTSGRHRGKKWLCLSIAGIVVVLVLIWLGMTNPTKAEYEAKLPQDFKSMEAKKESVVKEDYHVISCYIVTKQINSVQVERQAFLGFGGHIYSAESGAAKFTANTLTWMKSLIGGTKITILLTITSVATGILLSLFLALGKMSKIKPVQYLCRAYIFFFRGTPLLMQLYFIWFGLPAILPQLTIEDRFFAAYLSFSLNSGAYCAEIIRAAIESIDKGQFEAAKVLGFSYRKTMQKIIIPQTYRRLIPPLANEFIIVLKDASLTSIIALKDLSKVTSSIMTSTGEVSVFVVSMAIYLVITAFFSKLFVMLERRFGVYE